MLWEKGGSGVQEVAVVLCGLMSMEQLAEHFRTQISRRDRYKKVPRGISDTVVWSFFH